MSETLFAPTTNRGNVLMLNATDAALSTALEGGDDRRAFEHATHVPGNGHMLAARRKRRALDSHGGGGDDDFAALAAVASDEEQQHSHSSEGLQEREVHVREVHVRRRNRQSSSSSNTNRRARAAAMAAQREMDADMDGLGGDAPAPAAAAPLNMDNLMPAEVPAVAPEWESLVAEFGAAPDPRGCLTCDHEPSAPQSNADELARIGTYFDQQLENDCGSLVPVIYQMHRMYNKQVRARAVRTYVAVRVESALREQALLQSPLLDMNFVDVSDTGVIVLRQEHALFRDGGDDEALLKLVADILVDALTCIPDWPPNYILWHYVLHRPVLARTMRLMRRGALQSLTNAYIYSAHTRSADGRGVVPSQDGWKSYNAALSTVRSLHDGKLDKQLAAGEGGAVRQLRALINAPTRPTHVRSAPRFVAAASQRK